MRYVLAALRYGRPYWKLGIASLILSFLAVLIALAVPWTLKILIDNVLGHHPLPAAIPYFPRHLSHEQRLQLMVLTVIAGFLLVLLEHGLKVVDNYVNTKLGQHMVLDFRSDLFRHSQQLALAYHDQSRTGDFFSRINISSKAVGTVPLTIPGLARSIVTVVSMFWVAFLIDPVLALIAMIVVPLLYLSTRYYATHIIKQVRAVNKMEAESLSIVHESMSMLRVILAFTREEYEFRRFRDQAKSAVDARVRVTVRQTVFSLLANVITGAGTALVLGIGAYHVIEGELTVGQLLVIMTYIQAVYDPMATISSTVSSAQEDIVALERSFHLLEVEKQIVDAPKALAIEEVRGHITFDRVSFAYEENEPVLSDISFEVPPGAAVGIVGRTGAGKSTLVSLIPRFYDPTDGHILLDGVDLRNLSLASLRGQIGVVLQDSLLFSGTIEDNIRYGRLDATTDEVIEAAKAANAHEFIVRRPNQYQTVLGERGAKLSGGQRQRIAIARAFLKDAPILILDEPTSMIDSRTEATILEALERLMVGRTSFIIAHRLSTVHRADLILVLDHGKIVQCGTHDELMETKGIYRQMYRTQSGWRRRKEQAVSSPESATAGS